jgi:hypothetical protein
MNTKHLNQIDLSKRWNISHRTLERWRWKNKGPAFLKLGGRVLYELHAIEAFEALQRRLSPSPHETEAKS